jgi:hypothetical protein
MRITKITSFLVAAFMVLAASASARQARVIISSNNNYELEIDGRTYKSVSTTTINDLPAGRHTVGVYQVISRGILGIGKKRRQVSFEEFSLRNDDVYIAVNQDGRVRITDDSYYGNNNKGNRDGYGNNGQYGKSEGKGRGHKYGHYKNKNGKYSRGNNKQHHDDNDDDDDDGYYNKNDRRRDND